MIKYQAMMGKVIVEVLDAENISKSGLTIVRMGKVYPLKGRVVSVGKDRVGNTRIFRAPCKIGDIVHYKKGVSFQITSRFDQVRLCSVYFGDIVGVERGKELLATYDNVIVQTYYKDTSDLIYIPDKFQKRIAAFFGLVHAIGPEYRNDLKIGDKLVFPRDEGFPMVINDNLYHTLYPEHARAVINCTLEELGDTIA